VLSELDASNRVIAHYVHGPQVGARLGADGSQRYYLTDAIGNVVALTDESGRVTDRYAYLSFGEPTGHEGSTANPFQYVGGLGVMAEADGLCFMRARFYEQSTGRFISKDPQIIPVVGSRYPYGRNQPVLLVDPMGLAEGPIETFLQVTGPGRQFYSLANNVLKFEEYTGAYTVESQWLPNMNADVDEWTVTQDLTAAGKLNRVLKGLSYLDLALKLKNGDWRGAGENILSKNPFLGGILFADELPTYFGAPRTVFQDAFGPDWLNGNIQFLYGPKEYAGNIVNGYNWLAKHPSETQEALGQFWWGNAARGLFPSRPSN